MGSQNHLARHFYAAFVLLVAGTLAGCTPTADRPEMKRLAEANSIHIQEGWGGLGVGSSADYVLKRDGDRFKGEAHFTAGKLEETASIELPPDVAKEFLRSLSKAKLEKRPYVPLMYHTDDYPSI